MRRRVASIPCLLAVFVAACVSAFTLDYCCEVDMHCAPCASMLCWVGQGSAAPSLIAPSPCATYGPVLPAPLNLEAGRFSRTGLALAPGFASDGSPPGSRVLLRV